MGNENIARWRAEAIHFEKLAKAKRAACRAARAEGDKLKALLALDRANEYSVTARSFRTAIRAALSTTGSQS